MRRPLPGSPPWALRQETPPQGRKHKTVKRIAAVVLGFCLLSGPVALGDDHRPPRATLRVAGQVQEGRVYHADGWAKRSRDPRYCNVSFATGFPKFRKPLKHSSGEEIVVRLHKPALPVEIEVQRWPRVDEDGHAAGTPVPLPWVLRPRSGGGGRSWEISVLVPSVDGHLYLGVTAYWADEDGCSPQPDLGSQYAAWTFHLVGR